MTICPTCGAGPFPTRKGYKAHLRSHQTVECDICGATVGALGLGSHRHHVHGIKGRAATRRYEQRRTEADRARAAEEAEQRVARGVAQALADMFPGVADALTDRLASFVAKHRPDHHLWIVATATAGPWLCRDIQLAIVARREGTLVVAVPVAEIVAHLERTEAA